MPADITALAHARASKDWALYAELRERAAQGKRQLSLLASAPATTFCFMVIRPNSYEEELLRAAMNDGGFPACTELRVYSNVSETLFDPSTSQLPTHEVSNRTAFCRISGRISERFDFATCCNPFEL